MATQWDPDAYLRHADDRSRPFFDLVARITEDAPARVLDLGCGPGQLTAGLLRRWPAARITGYDSSPEMIERAGRDHQHQQLDFRTADLRTLDPDLVAGPVDVVITNATLQWVPEHRALLPRLLDLVRPGGWFAMQVPGNFDSDLHRLLRELAATEPYASHTAGTERLDSFDPADYVDDLSAQGCSVDAWETTYLHILTGPDPVFSWIAGTGARPVLQSLPDDLRSEFVARYQAALREAYPEQSFGTVLPFRRVFAVARRP